MKKLISFLSILSFSISAYAIDANTVLITQVDPTGSFQQTRFLAPPLDDSFMHFNTSTSQPEWAGMTTVTMTSSQISDTSSIGRDLMAASNGANARSTIGAGTSNFSGAYGDLTGAPTNLSSFTNGPGFITAATAPVTSVNGSTGGVTITATGIGAASSSHTHTASQISDSTTIGRQLVAATDQASVKSIAGVPTAVSQLTNDSAYITSASITGKLTATKYTGSTNGSGVYAVTYGSAYGSKPSLTFAVEGGTNKDTSVLTATTTTGFSIIVERRSDVLGLLPTYAPVSGAVVNVIVTP